MNKTICAECIHYDVCYYRLRNKEFADDNKSFGMFEYPEGNKIQYAFETVAAKKCQYKQETGNE